MSNIANQVVAVVATLLGFIAHDFLTEAKTAGNTAPVAIAAAANVDPIVTRSVSLPSLSIDPQCASTMAEAMPAALERTSVRMSTVRTASLIVVSGPRANVGPVPAGLSAAGFLR